MKRGILYISYDGMLEPLGQSQVLAYLERLASDRPVDLISFEKKEHWADKAQRNAIRKRCSAANIRWHPMRYHKRPSALATAYDIAAGSARAVAIALRRRPAIVHARSYVPGLMALAVKKATGAKFLFDMRGFWPEERVDGGIWPADGKLYKSAKTAEARMLRAADHIITLTEASLDDLANISALAGRATPITVIPTCADLDRFVPPAAPAPEPFTIGHIGTVGTWYLLDEMVRAFTALTRIRPDARWLIVNRGEHDLVKAALKRHGVPPDKVELTEAAPSQMPALIGRMHAGMAIIRPAFSKRASAPTKLAEYLGCGVPCLGNRGVGDMQAILDGRQVGIAIHDFDDPALEVAAMELLDMVADPATAARCRETALELFSLDSGVEKYRSVYESLER